MQTEKSLCKLIKNNTYYKTMIGVNAGYLWKVEAPNDAKTPEDYRFVSCKPVTKEQLT